LLFAGALPVLVATSLTVAPAVADPIQHVTINGAIPDANGTGLQVGVTLSAGQLTLTNPASNNADIIGVSGTLNSGTVSLTNVLGFFQECQSSPTAFQCDTGIGIGPGSDITFTLDYSQPYSGGLSSVNVMFDNPACSAAAEKEQSATSAAATVSDANCTVPSNTTITSAMINKTRHTASFHFKARHATSFRCELIRGDHIVFLHSCRSPARYFGKPMTAGNYIFLVRGVNAAGLDPKFARRNFTLR
jgi:hypothetical protein